MFETGRAVSGMRVIMEPSNGREDVRALRLFNLIPPRKRTYMINYSAAGKEYQRGEYQDQGHDEVAPHQSHGGAGSAGKTGRGGFVNCLDPDSATFATQN